MKLSPWDSLINSPLGNCDTESIIGLDGIRFPSPCIALSSWLRPCLPPSCLPASLHVVHPGRFRDTRIHHHTGGQPSTSRGWFAWFAWLPNGTAAVYLGLSVGRIANDDIIFDATGALSRQCPAVPPLRPSQSSTLSRGSLLSISLRNVPNCNSPDASSSSFSAPLWRPQLHYQ